MAILLDAFGVPIRPRDRQVVRKWIAAANIADRPEVMYVTATEWGWGMDELVSGGGDDLGIHYKFLDPTNLPKPGKTTRIKLGFLEVRNAGTEDQSTVNLLNWMSVSESFLHRKREMQSGRQRAPTQQSEAL